MRSITSELSHLFMTLPIFKWYFLIPYLVHIYRYTKHWSTAVDIQKKQFTLFLVMLTLLDWYIIYLVVIKRSPLSTTVPLSVISGVISWYFVYDAAKRVEMPSTTQLHTEFIDSIMIIFLIVLGYTTRDPRVVFFVISDLVYHILERILPIQNVAPLEAALKVSIKL